MVYGMIRERYSQEDFNRLKADIDLNVLIEEDPEAAQEELNRRAAQD